MSSTYGENLKLSIFGQSHGAGIGMTLDGIPAGLPVDTETLQQFLDRRAPGQNDWSTKRKEADRPEILSGIVDGYTCGAPIAALIRNTNPRSGDYANLMDQPRPGHADYTAQIKYGGFQDAAGGGHFSGRLTAPLCIAGGMCKQWLDEMGIRISARIVRIGSVTAPGFDPVAPNMDVPADFPAAPEDAALQMQAAIEEARKNADSIGGQIQCAITGVPAGIGEPMFGGVESRIAQIVYGIPAVKAVEFGDGVEMAGRLGSQNNDSFIMDGDTVKTTTNRCGGVLGGITDGMPVLFTVTVKPTPSIGAPQQTVSLSKEENTQLQIAGRHDPCIVPRAVPVVEAAAAIAIYDMILGNTQTLRRK